jgi:hypothetical protein
VFPRQPHQFDRYLGPLDFPPDVSQSARREKPSQAPSLSQGKRSEVPGDPSPHPQEQGTGKRNDKAQITETDSNVSVSTPTPVLDYTKIPKLLDKKFEAMDKEGAVRPTIIHVGKRWTKTSKKSLLSSPTTSTLEVDEQASERSAAFDLLDALTKSGGFVLEDASLHVVITATHCFDRSLLDTVVERNVNPIEKVELSSMIMASTIHNEPVEKLVSRG